MLLLSFVSIMPEIEYRYLKKRDGALTVGVISAPFSGGQPRGGVDFGPERLVESGLVGDAEALGWTVDQGAGASRFPSIRSPPTPDEPIGKLLKPRYVSTVNRDVAEHVYAHASRGDLALTLGGDHSLALATVSGTFRAHPEACLIWIDAHADLNTPLTTPSGNIHGCPVSFLLGLEGTQIPEFDWIEPILKAERLVYIGLRDIDAGEKELLKKHKIKAFSMHHVDRYGIGKVVEDALAAVDGLNRPIHLSFDVDALDPSVTPSTGTPVRGGLTFREGHYIVERIAETGNLVSFDCMEVRSATRPL